MRPQVSDRSKRLPACALLAAMLPLCAGLATSAPAAEEKTPEPGSKPASGGEKLDVDARLLAKVDLHLKGIPLSRACSELSRLTGVSLSADRGVADENVTLLLKGQPARSVMREVARLFGYFWARSGVPGAYRYQLTQDLRSRITEEELRNRDMHAALLALDQQMTGFGPLLDLTPEQLAQREKQAAGPEKQLIQKLRTHYGAYQAYGRLSSAQRLALANGEDQEMMVNAADPARRLPAFLRDPLIADFDLNVSTLGGREEITADHGTGLNPTPLAQFPDAIPYVRLKVERGETGQLQLKCERGATITSRPDLRRGGTGDVNPTETGKGPGLQRPDNATANASLRKDPRFDRAVTIEPVSSCPEFAPGPHPPGYPYGDYTDVNGQYALGPEPPHVFSADVWEAVHRASGLPIVADSYSRLVLQDRATAKNERLFDALSRIADEMGVRWQADGDYLLARSTSYYWDKVKEVPRPLLERWQKDRKQSGGLPLRDLLEVAALRDDQVNSSVMGKVAVHCWGLEEWGVVANQGWRVGIGYQAIVPFARVFATFSPRQLQEAASKGGTPFETLLPQQQELLAQCLRRAGVQPDFLAGMRLRIDYVPAGQFIWFPAVSSPAEIATAYQWPVQFGPDRDRVLAAARQYRSDALPEDIYPSKGMLQIECIPSRGDAWKTGGSGIGVRR